MKRTMLKGYLYVIASAVIFGCMPLLTKLIYAEGANAMTVEALRNAMALPLLALMAFRQGGTLKIEKKQLPQIFLIALFGCCVTPYLLFSSYRFIDGGTATVLHFIYPAMVVVGSIVFLRAKVNRWTVVSVVICVAGIGLFYSPAEGFDLRGGILAVASGVAFTVYVLLLSVFKRGNTTNFQLTFYVVLISAIVMFGVCMVTDQLAFPTSLKGWLLCAVFAASVSAGAVALFQLGTFLIGGQKTSILSTLEPITGIILGAAFFHEAVTLRTLIGSAMVISASILIAVFDGET